MSAQIVVALLAAVAFSMLVIAGWKWRGERGTAIVCLVCGLLLGGVTAFRVWPAMTFRRPMTGTGTSS